MGLQDEYAAIREGMKHGTLKPPPAEKPAELWVSNRFGTSKDGQYTSLGEHYNAREASTIAYSFGKCSLKDSLQVSIPNDMKNATPSISPGPQVYNIKGGFGPGSAQFFESSARHSPSTHFGTDLRHSAELREMKSCGIPVDKDLEFLRMHSMINTFSRSGRNPNHTSTH